MVGQISTCLAGAGLNIADLLNKSRGEYAYTLIDADGAVPATMCWRRSRAIEGVLSARHRLHERAMAAEARKAARERRRPRRRAPRRISRPCAPDRRGR